MDKFLNVLKILCAFILSVLLFFVLLIAPILSATSAFIQKETIQEVVKNIDVVEILQTDESFVNELQQSGLTVDMLDSFFNTKAVDDVIELYVTDLFDALDGNMEIDFNGEQLIEIANNNMNELLPVFKDMIATQSDVSIDEEQIKEYIKQTFSELTQMFPTAVDLLNAEMDQETQQMIEVVKMLHVGTIVMPFVVIAVILSLLILACRWKNLEGFIWLAVVYFMNAGIMFSISSGLTDPSDLGTTDLPIQLENALFQAFAVFADKIRMTSFVLAGCAVLFMGIFIVFFNIRNKRKQEENQMMI